MVSMLITNWDIWAPPGLAMDSITKEEMWKCTKAKTYAIFLTKQNDLFFRILWWTLDGKIFETIKRPLYNYHYILIVDYSICVRYYNNQLLITNSKKKKWKRILFFSNCWINHDLFEKWKEHQNHLQNSHLLINRNNLESGTYVLGGVWRSILSLKNSFIQVWRFKR